MGTNINQKSLTFCNIIDDKIFSSLPGWGGKYFNLLFV